MKKSLPLSIIISFLFLFISAPSTHAQVQLVVSPPRIDIEANPGDVIQKTIKVTNPSDTETLNLRTLVKDFIVQDDFGTPIPVDAARAGKYVASNWFTLDQTDFSIAPQEQVNLMVIITIPKQGLAGGHYAGVFLEPTLTKGIKDTVSYTAAQVGTLFSVTVAGDIKYDALIKEFDSEQRIYEFGPVSFKAVLENQSDTHISPLGKIVIKNMLGGKVAELPLDKYNVFPFTSRIWEVKWDQIWGLGRYSAELNFTYGNGNVASRVIEFWLLPYRLLTAIGVVILALIGIVVSVRRHLQHKHDDRDQEIDELKRRIAELENNKR